MDSKVIDWYRGIGFPDTVLQKVKEYASLVESYYGMTFDHCFIGNVNNNGVVDYSSLWFFTNEDVVECKQFLIRMDIDIAKFKGNVNYVNIISDNNSVLSDPSHASSMKLGVSLGTEIKCYFNAWGANCQKLSEVAQMFLAEYKAK